MSDLFITNIYPACAYMRVCVRAFFFLLIQPTAIFENLDYARLCSFAKSILPSLSRSRLSILSFSLHCEITLVDHRESLRLLQRTRRFSLNRFLTITAYQQCSHIFIGESNRFEFIKDTSRTGCDVKIIGAIRLE